MIQYLYLGRVGYKEGLRLQAEIAGLRLEGRVENVLLLLEHPPVLTLGRNADRANVLASEEMLAAHYFYVVGAIMVVSGILLLVNRFVGLGLTLLGPVLFNILTYHLLMNPSGIGMGAFAALLWLLVAWEHRIVFERLFAARLEE